MAPAPAYTYTYVWMENGAVIPNANGSDLTVSPTVTTTYSVTVSSGSDCTTTEEKEIVVHPSPEANAGLDQTIPYGTSTTLSAGDAGTGATYSWSPANMIQGNANQQTVTTVNLTSDQTYTLTVTKDGCEAIDQVTVHVESQLEATATANPATICAGETSALAVTATNGIGNYTYSWTPANLIASGQSSANATTTTLTQTTTFTCTVSDGNQSVDVPVTVIVRPLPEASVTADDMELCTGNSTVLHAATVSGATYSWEPANMIQSGANQPNATTKVLTQTTTFTLTVTKDDCTNTDEITITVNEYPEANAGPDQNIPYNTSSTLNAGNAGTGATYSWSPVNMIQGNANQQTVTTVNLTSDQTYTLTVTLNGCSSTSTVTVHVGNELMVTATANPETICQNESSTLTVTATNGTGNYNYSWTPANLIASGQTSVTATTTTLTETTTFTCTVNDGNETKTATVTVTVRPLPEATATADDTELCTGNSTVLHAATVSGATYSWEPANMIQGSANQQNVTTITLTEITTFTLTVTKDGCTNTDQITITVNEYPEANAGPDQNIDPTVGRLPTSSKATPTSSRSRLPS